MKTAITAQQLVYFRQQGHIRFEHYPLDFQIIQQAIEKTSERRDLWRTNPPLKKLITQMLGLLAIELTGQPSLRLACDQWIETTPTTPRLQDLFCFQGLLVLFVFSLNAEKGVILDIFEPSSLSSHVLPNSYLVAFGRENARIIKNEKDPFTIKTRNLGYVYGDQLRSEFHPLIHPR